MRRARINKINFLEQLGNRRQHQQAMASALSVVFRPLGGVHGRGAPCYLLQVDDFTFLLDCGLSASGNASIKEEEAEIDDGAKREDLMHTDYEWQETERQLAQ